MNILLLYKILFFFFFKQIKRARSPSAELENDTKLRAIEQIFPPSIYTSNL